MEKVCCPAGMACSNQVMCLLVPPEKNGKSGSIMQCPGEGCQETSKPSQIARHFSKGCISRGTLVFFGACQTSPDGSRRFAYVSDQCYSVGQRDLLSLSSIADKEILPNLIQAELPDFPMTPAAPTPSKDVEAQPRLAKRSRKSHPEDMLPACAIPACATPAPMPSQGDDTVRERMAQYWSAPANDSSQRDAETSQADAEQPAGPAKNNLEQHIDKIKRIMEHTVANAREEERQQLKAREDQLKACEKQLKAREKQLKAGQDQLKAGQEQLKAHEEQLNAREEQLKVDQDEVKAREEQVKRDQEQVKADQKQHKANRQQLEAAEEQLEAERQAEREVLMKYAVCFGEASDYLHARLQK